MNLKGEIEKHPIISGILLIISGGTIVLIAIGLELLPYVPKKDFTSAEKANENLTLQK